jgi:hypothetical protein
MNYMFVFPVISSKNWYYTSFTRCSISTSLFCMFLFLIFFLPKVICYKETTICVSCNCKKKVFADILFFMQSFLSYIHQILQTI